MDVEDKHVFYDKLTFVYLEMPKFNKTEDELDGMMDKWLYVLRNLSRLMERPAALQERVFNRLFEQAEIARLSPTELRNYEESIKVYRDITNVVNTAEKKGIAKGIAEGIAKGKREVAVQMKLAGIPVGQIAKFTGLTEEEIGKL